MKLFIKIFVHIILVLSSVKVFATEADTSKFLSVTMDIIAPVAEKSKSSKWKDYYVVITLTNTEDTTIKITFMTCGWAESFITNVDSIGILNQECGANFPTTEKLSPGQSIKFFGTLYSVKKDINNSKPLNFKLAFINLPYKYFIGFHQQTKLKTEYPTYWSRDITLESSLGYYKIEEK